MRVALKILAVMVSLVLMVLAVEAMLRSRNEAALYEQDLRRDQRILGRALREAGELTWREQGLEAAQRIVAAAAAGEAEVGVRLLHEDDVREELESMLAIPHVQANSDRDLFQFIDDDALLTVVPLAGPGEQHMALELSTPLTSGREYLAKDMRRFSMIALLLILTTSVLGVAAGGWIVGRPIEALVRQTRSLAAGKFVHSQLGKRDEIGQLGRALDRTSDRLAEAREQLEHETRQRSRAMDELRQADRLATVGTLAAGVAHELGTPLHVIAGRAQRISRSTNPNTVAQEAEVIVEQCAVVQDIVRGLLNFARSPARERVELDVESLIARTVNVVEPLLRRGKSEITVESREAPNPHTPVLANAGQLQQVFTNLLINAGQAMPKGGQVLIWTEHGQPSTTGDNRRFCVVHVQDQGAGMDSETLDHIYDPFFTTKEPGEGTGLGLSIAYGIVRDHGGWVEVSSELGHGAEFCVWLPEVDQ
jgi:signal transduction histidine kinase